MCFDHNCMMETIGIEYIQYDDYDDDDDTDNTTELDLWFRSNGDISSDLLRLRKLGKLAINKARLIH